MNLWLPGEQKAGDGIVREFGMDMYTLLYWDNQQGPTAWHRELCSVLCGSLDRRGVWGRMDACICMIESLCSPHETLTTLLIGYQFTSVLSLSHLQLFVTSWTAARQASLSITNSQSLLRLMSIESVIPSNHLILCCPLLLPPLIFPSIRVFSNESVLRIRCPKYWSFSFGISPWMNILDWFLLGWTGWVSLLSKGFSRVFSNTTVQKHQFFRAQLSL